MGFILAAASKRIPACPLEGAEQITLTGVGSVEHPTSAGGIRSSGRKVCPASGFVRKGVTRLDNNANQLREGQQAMAEYEAACAATREKTARLRALRLARDAGLTTPLPAAAKAADLIEAE